MPSNQQIIKDGQIVDNDWTIVSDTGVTDTVTTLPEGKLLVSVAVWTEHKESLLARAEVGLWLQNDQDLAPVADDFASFSVIAIDFPGFMDGRGFSVARLLRDRYDYKGEVRATGQAIRDQLSYLQRCGFNAFDLDESIDLAQALHSLNDFTESYQTSADQKIPLFRRRA